VLGVIRESQLEIKGVTKPVKRLETSCLPSKWTEDLIRNVDRATEKAEPLTIKLPAQRYDASRRSMQQILKEDLGAELQKKTRTHALANKQMQQCLDRARYFLQLIGGDGWKYSTSLDEAWPSMEPMVEKDSPLPIYPSN
jgi:hypothetical protein